MDSMSLRRLFAHALRASLATPLLLAGCDGDSLNLPPLVGREEEDGGDGGGRWDGGSVAGDLDLTGYTSPVCGQGGPAVTGLSLPDRPDFVELRQVSSSPNPQSDRTEFVASSTGTACATASDAAACQSALSAITLRSGFRRYCLDLCSEYYLATTRGDEVLAHTTVAALRSLLGTINTPQEAVLLVFGEGYNLSCSNLQRGAVRENAEGGYTVVATKGYACGPNTAVTRFRLEVTASGEVREVGADIVERGDPNCAIGRRPAGLRAPDRVACTDALGHHFAVVAHLEAASINAFLRLREELELHGADVALRDAALRSAMDEVLHTDVSTRLAHRFGATPRPPRVEALPPRPLFEVALDNAVEGCVRETFGALVAHHQALHAKDAQVRQELARIADDETRHAELSWAVDAWAREKLSPAERDALREAQRVAVEALRAEVAAPLDASLVTEAGLPAPQVALSLVDTLSARLWA